jgi:hypothetical protein
MAGLTEYMAETNRYTQLLEDVFRRNYRRNAREVYFAREELVEAAARLGVKLPKNLDDVVYSFRYRAAMPPQITEQAPAGHGWGILPVSK